MRHAVPAKGGHYTDEFKRWACFDLHTVIKNKLTNEPLTPDRFEALFNKYLIRSHKHHEFTRLFEGELQRLCLTLDMKKYWYRIMHHQQHTRPASCHSHTRLPPLLAGISTSTRNPVALTGRALTASRTSASPSPSYHSWICRSRRLASTA